MGTAYCTVNDILALGYQLTNQQQEAAPSLIETASAKLRVQAQKYGKNIDSMISDPETGADFLLAVKNLIVKGCI